MAKTKPQKRNATASKSPYQRPTPGGGGRGGTGAGVDKKKNTSGGPKNNTIFKFNTNLGQHILKNGDVCARIVDAAGIQPHDTVLEVGPGTGALTSLLLDKARDVTAVELDPRMAAELSRRVQGTPKQKKLRILLGDFIKLDMDEIPAHDVCVSNTPYQISSPLIFKLLALPKQPRTAILMFQREFALRLLARPGDAMYSRLSVNAQFFANISHVMKVGPKNFTPPPQVDSSVVRLEPRTNRPPISFDEFDGMLRVCFMRKNRTMRASWTGGQVKAMMARNWMTWAAMFPEKLTDADRAYLRGEGDDEEDGDNNNDDDDDGDDNDMDMDGGGAVGDDMGMDLDDDDDGIRPTRGKQPPPGKFLTLDGIKVARTRVEALVRKKTAKVLDETGLGPQRSAKCDETDFLRLLFAFNNEGLHFS